MDWSTVPRTASAAKFIQKAIYPEDSILHEYMRVGREVTEGVDAYLLGSILPICGRLLARRVYIPWGSETKYTNNFVILVGKAGDRKSSTINLSEAVARKILPSAAFIPLDGSPESLFDGYCPESGGVVDRIWVADDANIVIANWVSSPTGERLATRFLGLYDCRGMDESYMRNKEGKKGNPRRTIPETSTNILFGATFNVCSFQKTQVQTGMERRFLYYLGDGHGRLIVRPPSFEIGPLADTFKPLLKVGGSVDFSTESVPLWEKFQKDNRKQQAEAGLFDNALSSRLCTVPTHVLKIAMIFEACRVVFHHEDQIISIGEHSLELAIAHVEENMRAAECLSRIGSRASIQEQSEIVLSAIRKSQSFQRKGDSIYGTKSELTREFCHNTGRRGSISVREFYDSIIPHMVSLGECQQVVKKGKLEVYAFPTEAVDGMDDPPEGPAENSPNSSFSSGGISHTHTPENTGIGEEFGENNVSYRPREESDRDIPPEEFGENEEFAQKPTLVTDSSQIEGATKEFLE